MTDKENKGLNFNFMDLTTLGKKNDIGGISLVSNEDAYNLHPEIYAFYQKLLSSINDPALIKSIEIAESQKSTIQKYNDDISEIAKQLKYALKHQATNPEEERQRINRLNILLRSNPLTSSLLIKHTEENLDGKNDNYNPLLGRDQKKKGIKFEGENGVHVILPNKDSEIYKNLRASKSARNKFYIDIKDSKKYIEVKYQLNDVKFDLDLRRINDETLTHEQMDLILEKLKEIHKKDRLIAVRFLENPINNDNYKKSTVFAILDSTTTGGKNPYNLLQIAGAEAITFYSNLEKEINRAEVDNLKDTSDKVEFDDNGVKKKSVSEIYKDYQDDPIFGLESDKITSTDRAVFIGLTYIIRAISLFLLNWGINSNMITNFEKAFILYFTCYISILTIIIILINTENNLFFRLSLYYLDTKNNGPGRIIVHFLMQLGLMPILWLLKVNTNSLEIIDFASGQRIYNIISTYTFFIWVFSSIVALKY